MIPDLFAENGEIDFARLGKAEGKAKVAAFYRQALSDLVPFVKQFIHNHVITLNGDTGTGLSYLEAKPIFKGWAGPNKIQMDESKRGGFAARLSFSSPYL